MPAATVPTRIRRLSSLNKSPLGQRPKPVQRPAARKHTCCDDPKVEDDGDGHMVCRNCFTQVSESNIVADVTFQEDSRGAATVQGGFIGENARHARTLGSAAYRRVGGGEKNTLQEIERSGRRQLAGLCPRLGIPETIMNQAVQLFMFASQHNFSTGRRTEEVIAACLYAACRRQKDNTVLLIDISELLHLNVFRLGEVYKAMCHDLYLDDSGVGTQHLVEVESLIMKYCRKLEFGDATRQVAEDAAKIVRRMKRDWMVTGRHPAGLCGACIILAARMNNFRRTTREIVYIAKVSDVTIAKRVEEFRRTKAAALTVDQFREFGVRLKHQHDPPILYESELNNQKFEEKKRKRQEASEAREVMELSDDESSASSRESSVATAPPAPEPEIEASAIRKRRRTGAAQSATPAPTQQEPRRDADGFVIPPLPIDPAIVGEEQPKRKRGRAKKQPPAPIIITEEELADEADLEKDIELALNDEQVVDAQNEIERAKGEERLKLLAEQQKKVAAEKTKSRRQGEGITWWDGKAPPSREEITAEDLEAEFADDPEVRNCLLSEGERQTKERIWVHDNEDWLRQQHEKKLIEAVAQAAGRNEKGKKGAKGGKRRRKGRMGDGTTIAEATTPIETPADAHAAMLEKRAPPAFSKYINYEALAKVFKHSPSTSTSASRAGSETPGASGMSRGRTPSTAGRAGRQERDTASPTPSAAGRLQSPPATQQVAAAATSPTTPARARPVAPPAPTSPPQTQLQATEAAEDQESEGDEADYVQRDMEYGSDAGTPPAWGDEDDREDIGEDYQRAIDPTSRVSLPEDVLDEFY